MLIGLLAMGLARHCHTSLPVSGPQPLAPGK
jgi:hypothetical protein